MKSDLMSNGLKNSIKIIETPSHSISEEDLDIEIIRDEYKFRELANDWRELAKRTDAIISTSYEWSYTWWKHFGRNKKRSLSIVTLWDKSQLVAVAPFYIGYTSLVFYKVEKRMQLIGSGGSISEQYGYLDDYGISDFLDILVDPLYIDSATKILSHLLLSGYLNVDVLTLNQARDDSYVLNHLYPALKNMGADISKEVTDTCPYVDLQYKSLKEFISDQKSNARRRLRKTQRAVGKDKEFVIEEATSREEVEKATEDIIRLHQERWNKLGFPGVFYDKRFERFFRDTIDYAYENNWLWFKQTRDKEGVCASRMLLKYNNRYFDYISGFDDDRDSAKYRPGIALLIDVVKDGIEERAKTIELLRGEERYKYDFTSKNFNNWKIRVALPRKTTLFRRAAAYSFMVLAFIYKYACRECQLLDVQRTQSGFRKMIPGYISFRWKSLKLKLQE